MSGAVTAGALVINMSADVATLKTNMADGVRVIEASSKKMGDDLAAIRKGLESALSPLQSLTVKVGSLESQMNKAQGAAISLAKGLILGAAAGMSIDAIKSKIFGVIDSMAALKTMSEKTGSSVENLSKLGFAAKMSGSDLDSVAGALAKMSKGMAGADNETKGAGLAMSYLGLSAKDAAGNLKDPAVMFTEVAKKLAGYEDGAGKAAIAQALFGKAGADILPTLKMLGEQGDIAAKATDAQATAARQYTRDVAKLDAQKGMLFKTIAIELLPALRDFTESMIDASKGVNMTNGAVKGMAEDHSIGDWADSSAMGVARLIDVIMLIPRTLTAVAGSFKAVGADVEYLYNASKIANPVSAAIMIAKGGNPNEELKKLAADRNKIVEDANKKWEDLWNKPANQMESAMAGRIAGRNTATENSLDAVSALMMGSGGAKKKLNYNSAGEDGDKSSGAKEAAAAAAANKATLEADINNIKAGIEIEKAMRAEALAIVAEQHRQGIASDAQFYAAKYAGAIAAGEDIARVKMAEIDRLADYNNKDVAEENTTQGKIDKLWTEKNETLRASLAGAALLRTQYLYDADKPARDAQAAADIEVDAVNKSVAALQLQIDSYGRLPAAITAVTIAKLQAKTVALETNEGTLAEIANNNRLIVSLQALAGAQAQSGAAQLHAENKKFAAESLVSERDRAHALTEIDADKWRQSIAAAGDGTEAQKRLQTEFDTWYINQSIKPALDAQKAMWASIDQTAHDTFVNVFQGGKNAFDKLRDTLKSGLLDLLYQMTIKKWIFNIAASVTGSGAAGAAQGADSSGMGSAVSTANSLYKLYNGGVAGALSSVGGAVSSVGSFFGSASTAAYGTGMSMTTTAAATAAEAYTASAAAIATSDAALAATYTGVAASLTEGAAVAATTTAAAGTVASALATIPVVGWIAAAAVLAYAAFGGKGKKETTATGVEGTFGSGTFTGNNFAEWKQKGGWFSSDSTGHDASALDAATAKQFSSGYAALQTGAANAADSLGLSAAAITNYSEKISLALTGDATKDAAAVTALFTDVGNNLAAAVAPGIGALEKEGESASTALSRLSGSIITANSWLSMLRQRLFQVSLAGGDAASKLADAFGGLDGLTASSKAFYESYYTDGERAARSQADMAEVLGKLNIALPDSKDSLRALADTLDLNTTAGRTAYATLLKLAPEFSDTAAALEKLAKETADTLIKAFTGNGQLTPALDAATLKTLGLASYLGTDLVQGLSSTTIKAIALATGMSDSDVQAKSLTLGMAGLTLGLSDSQIMSISLATGLSTAQIKSGNLTDSLGSMGAWANTTAGALDTASSSLSTAGTSAGSISAIFLDTSSGILTFGGGIADLRPLFTGAQLAAGLLSSEIDDLKNYASGTTIDIAGLSTALLGVNSSPVGASVDSVNSYLQSIKVLPVGTSVADVNAYLAGVKSLPVGTTIELVNAYLAGVKALPLGTAVADVNSYLTGVSSIPVGTSMAAVNSYLAGVSALPVGTSIADANNYLAGIWALPVGTSIAGVNEYLAGISAVPVGTSIQAANAYLAGVSAVPVGTSIADANAYLRGVSALPVGTSMASVNAYLAGVNALPVGTSITAINTALNGVDTTTFVTTMGLVFESLATRIKGVIGGISTERVAVRDAALQIINPTVMSRDAILRSIGAINTRMPSNAGLVTAQNGVVQLDGQVQTAQRNEATQRALLSTYTEGLAATKKWQGDISTGYNANVAYLAVVKADLVDLSDNRNSSEKTRLMAADNAEINRVNGDIQTLQAQWGQVLTNIDSYTAAISNQQGVITAAADASNKMLSAQAWWVQYAKTQQLAYVAALQDFTIDASKSVSKLTKLREETVKYYDAQKQLADLMGKSAAGLRDSVSAYRYAQLTPNQQFRNLEAQYNTAYSMALSTDGATLVGYSDKMSSLLGPLMDKMKEAGYTNSWDQAFINTMMARADAVAARVELLTPIDYAADSLAMLGQIDGTLAALEDSSKSAEKIISDAVNAGSDKTANGLRAVIAALTGQAIPAFAAGGAYQGGLALVGERGPELINFDRPGQIYTADQTTEMFSGGRHRPAASSGSGNGSAEVVSELRALRSEVASQRAELRAIAISNAKMSRLADRSYNEGTLVRTDSDTPLKTVAA